MGGLNWDTDESGLKEYFSKYGTVTDTLIMRDFSTNRSRGFGFLTFADASSVDDILKEEHTIDGKIVDPKRAVPKEDQQRSEKICMHTIVIT